MNNLLMKLAEDLNIQLLVSDSGLCALSNNKLVNIDTINSLLALV